jgi:hypothetical protein
MWETHLKVIRQEREKKNNQLSGNRAPMLIKRRALPANSSSAT